MSHVRRLGCLAALAVLLGAAHANAGPDDDDGAGGGGRTWKRLRDRYGAVVAARLVESSEVEERARGLERAASVAAPLAGEACAKDPRPPQCDEAKRAFDVLVEAAKPSGAVHGDARIAIIAARALAPFCAQAPAVEALGALLDLPAPAPGPDRGAGDALLQAGLARQLAAMALATCGTKRATDQLVFTARKQGIGQLAAVDALAATGQAVWSPSSPPPSSPLVVRAMVESGDLRALDALRACARAGEPGLRAACMVALGELGDGRVAELAMAGLGERDARLRTAAAEALVLVDASPRFRAVEALVSDDVTAAAGIRLAHRAQDAGVVKALAQRAQGADLGMRRAVVAALGRGTATEAVQALAALAADRSLEAEVFHAIARSPSDAALPALVRAIEPCPPQRATKDCAAIRGARRRLVARAYVVRALSRGERSGELDDLLAELARAADARDRAVGVAARVALGQASVAAALADSDPSVRRAAAVAAGADPGARAAMLERFAIETDPRTRIVLAGALLGGDPGFLPTLELVLRAESGEPDAGIAAETVAARGDELLAEKVDRWLASPLPVLRAHVARGLGRSKDRRALGKLLAAYEFETEPTVRRAILEAIAERGDVTAPLARMMLARAARLDPDAVARGAARRALAGLPARAPHVVREVAWLRVVAPYAGDVPPLSAALVRSDGLAQPIAFDDDGFAIVPGIPPGPTQLVFAPAVPSPRRSEP